MARLILASSSPRRKELLKNLREPFDIVTAEVDERINEIQSPQEMVMELALKKARAVAKQHRDAYVIGADTIVVFGNRILGKPVDEQHAKEMLRLLSGQTHGVYTGTAILHHDKAETFFEKTEVTFWELSEEEINRYVQSGEPLDKAGSYGIQGYGAHLVKRINGDFFSVVGLPVAKVYRVLKKMGYPFST